MDSFNKELLFSESKPLLKVILETQFTKEVRISMEKATELKAHKTPFPILIHLLEGSIELNVQGQSYQLNSGDVLPIEGDIEHSLKANERSVIRLTIFKSKA